jgi:DNA polymerase III sliding clamp (beta) subunit (PCNA family)
MDSIDLKTLIKIIKILDQKDQVDEFRLRVGNKVLIIKDVENEYKDTNTPIEKSKFDI